MSRFAYVNGRYVRHADAVVHVEDRGFQLGDGVYEVWAVFGGRLADAEGHFARLERSLAELRIAEPMGRAALKVVIAEIVRMNHVREGLVYERLSVEERALDPLLVAAGELNAARAATRPMHRT